ncbi:MAG: RNase adapter RapZ [Coriobacteriales bacterium]|jgi:UPF0042 nucleotide-binding protein|nr:RNase adapter RapZ [Coriobacteriales bacterium]
MDAKPTPPETALSEELIAGPDLVIITGMAGAGRTEAMHTFEDLGYFCIDNLPPTLLLNLVTLADLPKSAKRKLAVVCDLRAKEFFSKLSEELRLIAEAGVSYKVLFLDSRNDVLIARFKETRRRHPLSEGSMTLLAGIERERELLATAREMADSVIDTSDVDPRELRTHIRRLFSQETDQESMQVSVFSFGFKHGMPIEADLVIDVRFLPNPFYEPNLRHLTGQSDEVRAFILNQSETRRFLASWQDLLKVIMPGYVREGKQAISIGIGCTGGQHRSVVLADETERYLRQMGYRTIRAHRDLALAEVL